MTGLTAPPAVFPPLPLRFLPRPPRLFRPDPLLRARRPRVRAGHSQPTFQLSYLQLQPSPLLTLGSRLRQRRIQPGQHSLQPRPQRRVLRVLRLYRRSQPQHQITLLLTSHARLIGHEPQISPARTKRSNTPPGRRVAQTRAERGFTIISRGLLDDRTLNAARRNNGYHRLGCLSSAAFGYGWPATAGRAGDGASPAGRSMSIPVRVHIEPGLAYPARTTRRPARRSLRHSLRKTQAFRRSARRSRCARRSSPPRGR